MTPRYIVCDACYILNASDYKETMMEIWFQENGRLFVRDVQKCGAGVIMRDIEGNSVKLIRSMATKGGDCIVEGLGCDAGNFSLFESDSFWTEEREQKQAHVFRFFDTETEANTFLEKIISLS